MTDVLLDLRSISKKFPGVKALDNVNIQIKKGEVHSILGENGAGKSTLMKIISGALNKDEGEMIFEGRTVSFSNTMDSQKAGIAMIYQEFNLAPHLTVEDNVFIANEPCSRLNIVDRKTVRKRTFELLDSIDFKLDPSKKIKNLNVCEQQITEIIKALRNESKLIIMDEPTSALTENEIRKFFKCIDKMRSEGLSILFISHNLEEVFEISDTITVMRDGKSVGTYPIDEITPNDAVRLMVGREVENIYDRKTVEIGEEVLRVKNLSSPGKIHDVSFTLREGEVLGICGLLGAGKTEIVRGIFGADTKATGEVFIKGRKLKVGNINDVIDAGIGLIPEDRKNQGLFLDKNIKENLSAASIEELSKCKFLSKMREQDLASQYVEILRIKTSGLKQIVNNLSGGNQQKVVIGKWLALSPKVLLMDDPTRGVDIGAKQAIYKLIGELVSSGVGVIFISSELPEVIGISDRLLVIADGELKAEFRSDDATQEKILTAATLKTKLNSEKAV